MLIDYFCTPLAQNSWQFRGEDRVLVSNIGGGLEEESAAEALEKSALKSCHRMCPELRCKDLP